MIPDINRRTLIYHRIRRNPDAAMPGEKIEKSTCDSRREYRGPVFSNKYGKNGFQE